MGSNENGRNAGEHLAVNPAKPNDLYFGARLNGLWKTVGELVTSAGTDLGAGQDSGSGSDLQ
jgi:hypothetical protein